MFEPKSLTQNDAVAVYANDIWESRYIWLGITDAGTEGEWTYADGSVINFENWGQGEPGFPDFYDCAFMFVLGEPMASMDNPEGD